MENRKYNPFTEIPPNQPQQTRTYPTRMDSMQEALKDIVSVKPSTTSDSLNSDPYGDILASYDTPSTQMSSSPTKERESSRPGPGSKGLKSRDNSYGTPPAYSTEIEEVGSRSGMGDGSRRRKDEKSNGGSGKKERSGRENHRDKPDLSFDVIDRLDISGLYGGGGLTRHDGPFAAATAARNKGPRAPMAAFDPSTLAPPSSSRAPRSSSNLSARAAATLAAMDNEGGALMGNDGPYGAARNRGKGLRRSNSESSVNMGFPNDKAKGKGQQLIEIYGVRESEAWEDFGTGRYEPTSGTASFANSRDSVVPPGVSKEDRIGRAESIWDIEATLREGKPVGRAPPPPPVPVLPSEFHSSPENSLKPKRSKSLAQRFKSSRRNPNNPMMNEEEVPSGAEDGRQAGQDYFQQQQSPSSSPETGIRFVEAGGEHQQVGRRRDPPLSPSARFGGGVQMEPSKSLPPQDYSDREKVRTGGEGLSRRPSVMQRLFAKKKT